MTNSTHHNKHLANAIRFLTADAVERAKSGHPGMPMGMADVATILMQKHLRQSVNHPKWPDRDRFFISAGHGSMLIYSLAYLLGHKDITLDDIKNFRQLGSKTAGHPEYEFLDMIETTTGPLGQGIANAVGMAIASHKRHADMANDPDVGVDKADALCQSRVFAIAGDGCLMEGVAQEAIALAGHLGLGRLIVLFDDNQITIDGPTDLCISEDPLKRAEIAGWHIERVDGHNPDDIDAAIEKAANDPRPSMIACQTVIGLGAPNKQGKNSAHGAPLGADEIALLRENLDWPHAPFDVPNDILAVWRQMGTQNDDLIQKWQDNFDSLPLDAQQEYLRRYHHQLPENYRAAIKKLHAEFVKEDKDIATRKCSEMVLNALIDQDILPELLGGSADLTGSNNTKTKTAKPITKDDFTGNYLYYGIREHAMAGIMNGLFLSGSYRPFGGTFLVFSDYCRPSIRLSALMRLGVVYVMTHDSIGLGEDGPTHQPIEHISSLRAIPNTLVLRPADLVETLECWDIALSATRRPTILALSRQNLPQLRTLTSGVIKYGSAKQGAYVVSEGHDLMEKDNIDINAAKKVITIIATGSEVHLAMNIQKKLWREHQILARIVSMPSQELFLEQDPDYQEDILPKYAYEDDTKPHDIYAIEAGHSMSWHRFIQGNGQFFGIDSFGESAPAHDLFDHFGLTVDKITEAIVK